MSLSFIYTILWWAIIGGLVAFVMLVLKPRRVVLYGAVSAAAFIVTLNSWHLVVNGNVYASLRELVLVLTIPYLYWVFVLLVEKRSNLSTLDGAETTGNTKSSADK